MEIPESWTNIWSQVKEIIGEELLIKGDPELADFKLNKIIMQQCFISLALCNILDELKKETP